MSNQFTIDEHPKKRKIQSWFLPNITQEKVCCLGGPLLNEYVKFYPSTVKRIYSYEDNIKVYRGQIQNNENSPRVIPFYGSIGDALIDENTFGDLDFCRTIGSNLDTIAKFKDNQFMLTVSTRQGVDSTFHDFLEVMDEGFMGRKLIKDVNSITLEESLVTTMYNQYYYIRYCDKAPMTTIFKLKNQKFKV